MKKILVLIILQTLATSIYAQIERDLIFISNISNVQDFITLPDLQSLETAPQRIISLGDNDPSVLTKISDDYPDVKLTNIIGDMDVEYLTLPTETSFRFKQ